MIVRILLWLLLGATVTAACAAGLLFYLVWTPAPAPPQLSGAYTRGSIEVAGLQRTYSLYVPKDLPSGAPLLMVMHGADGGAGRVRIETGYGFERLADQYAFAVVYPNAFEGNWNACNVEGGHASSRLNIDDVGFLTTLADKLVADAGVDRERVFAMGISLGGQMAFRLALEAPTRFRAVAAVAAGLPAPQNFKCRAPASGTSSVMIVNGVEDPLNPYNGGEIQLFGLYRHGQVLSSRATGQYFADLNHIGGAPTLRELQVGAHVRVEDFAWRDPSRVEVELLGIHGAGHGLPQPYRRGPRLLGPSPSAPDGTALIWSFFARQR